MMDKAAKQRAYEKGVSAESSAAAYLRTKGYKILKTRYKTRYGEIDLVAVRDTALAFVEVKARKTKVEALESVTPRAQRRITQAALNFIAEHEEYNTYDMRFDVVCVVGGIVEGFSIHHLDNAWQPEA
jgi:putative endonuclease